jgi:hypothetical protein
MDSELTIQQLTRRDLSGDPDSSGHQRRMAAAIGARAASMISSSRLARIAKSTATITMPTRSMRVRLNLFANFTRLVAAIPPARN